MNAHRLGELRSIAYHQHIAERLAEHPEILETARQRLRSWISERPRNAPAAERWLEIINGPRSELVRAMTADDEPSRELRQSTPFAGAIDPRARWAIWNEVRERLT